MDHTPAAGASVAGLAKTYGTAPVLTGVDLTFDAGEVHALLGPNGAGKSTLLGCLSGAVQPDRGTITVGGTAHAGFTPSTASAAGIAILYQHLELFGDLTVAENVFLGHELTRHGQVWTAEQERRTRRLVGELGLDVDVGLPVSRLSVGERQVVAIARALRHEPRTLILDEPTAALSEAEVRTLLDLVRRLARERGIAVIYVTHLLREVLDVADRVSVLRDGSVLWTRPIAELDLDALVAAIAPVPVERREAGRSDLGPVLLELDAFEVAAGEVVGVFGLLGSGRTALLEGVAGVRGRRWSARLEGEPLPVGAPRRVLARGVALVPADRVEQALFPDLPAIENVLMPNYRRLAPWWRRPARERAVFTDVARHVGLEPPDPAMAAGDFSGGNAQKLAVGRWITGLDDTRVLLLDEPTQGVDVGARQDVYRLLRAYVAGDRRAVVFASSDAEEVVTLADRVVVLVDGAPVAVESPEIGEAALIALAHGAPRPTTRSDPSDRSAVESN